MSDTLTIALAQINPVVGDVAGNIRLIRDARARAAAAGADLVVFGELCVCGYPPEDLVLKGAFLESCEAAVHDLAEETAEGPAMLVGAPWRVAGKLHNAALLLDHGRVAATRLKHNLPNYGVFDEARVFVAGPAPGPVAFRGIRLGVMVCEDMWYPDVAETLGESGAEILVVLNGSPFEMDKPNLRLEHARARIAETGLPLVYVNQVGGQDELVFDGSSFVLDGQGRPAAGVAPWTDAVEITRWSREPDGWCCEGALAAPVSRLENVYRALVTGLRDYVVKNGFPGVVLGLSGGIDSALCAAIAVDALGPDKVWCVMMPSPYTSADSLEDAALVAGMLGTRLDTISIEPAMAVFGSMLAPVFAGREADITEENLQSRARGLTLMGISNKFGPMVLSTGNKSEMSCGYATLYGDMCGGYAVLKDVYKTTVFALSSWRNHTRPPGCLGPGGAVMPERVIAKPPSAELKPNQTDQDSLPPYDVLDAILDCLIEGEMSVPETCAHGFDEDMVRRVWRMLDRAEYKRRQAPPGVKVSSRAFGRERRYPITNAFTRLI
ncbi:NAD+ synthase [Magnetospirillum sp. SS-4]|uniref:NAD+ synthase n=1 Tax=Magnetospirillum sp. SS-4 TaxID=2681465 RepID=UPI00138156E8|nr:NAD+ synthase [Magnetospirillum sp. SS-4]CAA7623045.1 Glutamine-dependent NAD(+) synthetase [Magnetospirillum sp. SS-4]